MSVSIMTEEGLVAVPTRGGGGTSLELLTRIFSLESTVADLTNRLGDASAEIQRISGLRASYSQYGFAMLSDSSTATRGDGLVLPTSEKNAAIDGSLANKIEKVKQYECVSMMDHISSDKIPKNNANLHDCYVQKVGGHADLKLAFRPIQEIPGGELLFLVPGGFRPKRHVKLCAITESSHSFPVTVETDGRVYLDATIAGGRWTFIYVSYVVQ